MENFHASLTPRPMGDVYGIANFVAPETQLPLIAAGDDTGSWVAAILADFERYDGQVLCCATRLYTMQETVEIMSKASGKTIKHIQGLQAYHSGDKLNVEVDIVLDERTSLRDSHDLGESLQYVLESVPTGTSFQPSTPRWWRVLS